MGSEEICPSVALESDALKEAENDLRAAAQITADELEHEWRHGVDVDAEDGDA